jgi:hypothetical protein
MRRLLNASTESLIVDLWNQFGLNSQMEFLSAIQNLMQHLLQEMQFSIRLLDNRLKKMQFL